jgi:hypothetical protein
MDELRPGLWTWSAPHPSWTPDEGGPEGWEPEVRSYALDAGDTFVLFDPNEPPADVLALAAGRPLEILLTVFWHRRSSLELITEHGATVRAFANGIEQIELPAVPFQLGDTLSGGIEAKPGGYAEEAVFWIPSHGGLVAGDVLLGGDQGIRVQPDSWIAEGQTPEMIRAQLRPLLELPVELLLPAHGDPVTDDAHATLARAIAS